MAMKHFEDAQSMEIASLNIDGINAFLEDVVSSNSNNAPITCGLFRMEAGNPLDYTYTYDECKVMLKGEMTITENEVSKIIKPGDILFFDKGTSVTFSSNSSGLAFYVGQRKKGVL